MTRVLIVDDSKFDQQIAAACAQDRGCEVVAFAGNGHEALEAVTKHKPDVVLTDLQMPEMDGLELVSELRDSHPEIPVILMTAFGSEEIAAKALRAGAASYVPKQNLKQDLGEALRVVICTVEAVHERDLVRAYLEESKSQFVLAYDPSGPQALISYLQDVMTRLNFCDKFSLIQLATALTEAINNAIDHGNLELDSKLRESEHDAYRQLGCQRSKEHPYCDRRVWVTATLTRSEARFVIRDEGPGFDTSSLPDPTDPENLLKPFGRGIMLMRTFLDEVIYNDLGNEVTLIKRRVE